MRYRKKVGLCPTFFKGEIMSIREKLLEIFKSKAGVPVTGEDLATKLNVTRSAVWKNVIALREAGFDIRSEGNRGYIFSPENDVFTTESVRKDLGDGTDALGLFVTVVDESESTNKEMKAAAKDGAPEGTCLIAKKQTAGKGRLGRKFFSPKRGIYLSFILKPRLSMQDSMMLTTIAAVAVRDAIEEVCGVDTGIKWVNDVYIGNKKVAGILTEATADIETQTLNFGVVGIGINVTDPEGGWPEELKEIAGSIYGEKMASPGVMSKLSAAVIKNYFEYYRKLPERTFMESYAKNQILTGKDIYVIKPESSIKATALGVDREGRLMVRYEDGREETIFTGEVSVRLAGTETKNRPVFE